MPEYIATLPYKLMKPFETTGTLYRCIVVEKDDEPVSTNYCSWSEDYNVAQGFADENRYIDVILEDGGTPIAHIYKYDGVSISFNKLVDELLNQLKENPFNVETRYIEILKRRYEKYKDEKECFANFNLQEIELIEKFEVQ